jgi:N-acetylmuramoyl-L-alanine amidase
VIARPSPSFGARPTGLPVDMLILHYTGMASAAAALDRLCDAAAAVSAHYLIDDDGTVYSLVDEAARAWHAGVAAWAGETDINGRSIGIELVNPGHALGYRPFPEPQMAALADLAGDIVRRHPIPPARVLGHSDVAPARKCDPGELFDWRYLARRGIGLWPFDGPDPAPAGVGEVPGLLARFGYCVGAGVAIGEVVAAFQRHFRPHCIDGVIDAETASRLARLCDHLAPGA